jgi:membrane protein
VSRSHGGFLSLGFLLSAYFASNGMISIMRAFNQSVLVSETRSNLKIRLLALFLVVIVSLIVIIAAGLQVMSYRFIDFLSGNPFIPPFWLKVMIFLAKYLVLTFILFTIYSFIYYFAPARPGMYRFISAGSTLATIISIIALELFSYFINNFGHYNRVYGSLGTLIVILLLININALILLVGFELNASIFKAKKYDSRE